MALSHEIISQFAKIVNTDNKQSTESTIYGTVVDKNGHKPGDIDDKGNKIIIDEDGGKYIKPDGSDQLIPITDANDDPAKANTSTNTDYGDRASVLIKNHTATVTGNISSPSASNKDIDLKIHEYDIVIAGQIQADKAYLEKLISDKASIGELKAAEAKITELEADKASVEELDAAKAEITDLKATKIDADVVEANYAKIDDLDATNIKVGSIDADVADINTLMFGTATGNALQTSFANAVIALLGDAQIKSAMIESLNADKINAGSINTNKVKMESEDGHLLISDNTIQISDDTRVRVQIGKDANGDYSITIVDADGNVMFSEGGITEDAIKNPIIRDDMVSDEANINAKKLDINSLFTEMNADGAPTLKSTKVYFDSQEQTLDVVFNEMNTTVTEHGETIKSQGTDISVIQGQISSKIWQQDIDDAENTISTQYSKLEQDLSGFKTTVSETTTKLQGDIDDVSNELDSLEIGGRNLLRYTEKLPVTYDLETGLSTYLPTTVTGTIISVSNVSPMEHSLGIKLEAPPVLDNYFDVTKVTQSDTVVVNADGTLTVDNSPVGITLGYLTDVCPDLQPLDKINLSFTCSSSCMVYITNGSYIICTAYSGMVVTGTLPSDISGYYIATRGMAGTHTMTDITVTKEVDLSTVTVSRYGKNWFNNEAVKLNRTITSRGEFGAEDGSILYHSYTDVLPNTTYVFSWNYSAKSIQGGRISYFDKNKTWINSTWISKSFTFTTPQNCYYIQKSFSIHDSGTQAVTETDLIGLEIQLELGSTATEYEPYQKQTATANADGTVEGITSISPSMTICTDSNSGVEIECTYNSLSSELVFTETNEGLKYTVPASGKHGISIPLSSDGAIQNGENITVSFDYRGTLTAMGTTYLLQRTSPNVSFELEWNPPESETEWQHYRCTFSSNNANDRVCYALLLFYLGADSYTDEWVEIKKRSLKLERGNKATDWTPAPEDMATTNDLEQVKTSLASLTTTSDSIIAQVETIDITNKANSDNILNVQKDIAALKVSSEQVSIDIKKVINDGVTKVDTGTGFKFDIDGMTVDKDNAETNTKITENGMTVNSNITNQSVLTANKDGVDAENLHATTYLIVGDRSRFENLPGSNRTACFWIGE